MTVLRSTLEERRREFSAHLNLAIALDRSLMGAGSVSVGEMSIEVGHLLTIKSSLIVHLYNIVESVMTNVLDEIGRAVHVLPPTHWSDETLKEWLRANASMSLEGNEDTRLEIVHTAARKLLDKESIDRISFKKPSGNWSDKLIHTFSRRLNVEFELNEEIAKCINPSPQYGDKSPMEFLADRRNAIAHGRRTFERGADDLTIQDIEGLATVTLEYLAAALAAFQTFLDGKRYSYEMLS